MVVAVNRTAQGVVMLLFGGAVLRASLTDMYLRYVRESLQPFLVVASGLLIATGVAVLWYELRGRDEPPATDGHEHEHGHGHGHDHGHGHGHGHREPWVGWLLILPVLGLLMVAPPALGAYTATTAGAATPGDEPASGFPPLPETSPVELSVLDYAARVIWEDGRSLAGRQVQLTGFLVTDETGEQFLARLVLSCCAADARPIKIGMVGEVPAGLPDDTWVEVTGEYADQTGVDPINEATIPYLRVEQWQQVPAPSNPYG
jgi:uncharacterized repeat protein (TIGR03943 family)